DAQPLGIVAQHVAHAEVVDVLRTLLRPAGALFLARARIDFDEVDLSRVAAVAERAVLVVDVGDAARHAGREVAPGAAEHRDDAAGHVFAAMVAGAFDHGDRARIADCEALARDAVEVGFAGDGAVEHVVAHDDVLGRVPIDVRGRTDDDAPARKALADVVVGIAHEIERDAVGEPGAEALPGDPLEVDAELLRLEAGAAVAARDLA